MHLQTVTADWPGFGVGVEFVGLQFWLPLLVLGPTCLFASGSVASS